MFTKRQAAQAQPQPSSASIEDGGDQGVRPNQIPFVNPRGPIEAFDQEEVTPSLPEVSLGFGFPPPIPPTPPAPTASVEDVLANPTAAEDRLHAALTVRALKWLEIVEKDDQGRDPITGKPLVDLDTQVAMFKVISDWLKTSKKTKNSSTDEDSTAPGIEQMRTLVREEVTVRAKAATEDKPRRAFKASSKAEGPDDNLLALNLNRARQAAMREQ